LNANSESCSSRYHTLVWHIISEAKLAKQTNKIARVRLLASHHAAPQWAVT
jgi:hypothetical protein